MKLLICSSVKNVLFFACFVNCLASFAQCPNDHDCDGIDDLNDFDDDNDGISDIEELSNCINFSNIGVTGQLLYDEDFGAGPNWGNALPSGVTSYCYQDGPGGVLSCPSLWPSWAQQQGVDWYVFDGEYTILNNPNVGFPDAFRVQDDHTPNDVNGYQMVINADFAPGEMYRANSIPIPSSNFQAQVVVLSVWVSNIGSDANQAYCTNTGGGLISPNIDFILEDGSGTPIGTPISTGNLPFVSNGANAWNLYTAAFQVTGISSVNIVIKNNAPGGCGNDLAIDDISVYYEDVDCDFDQDGIADYLDLDSDNDGIYDVIEGGDGNADTNGDGVIDFNDLGFSDVDMNGYNDASELTPPVFTDGDALPDYLDLDSDDDGCYDAVEAGHLDTDDDGVLGISPVIVNAYGVIQNQQGYNGTLPAVTDPNGQIAPDVTYPDSILCNTGSAILPVVIGSNSGVFSSQPSGLNLDSVTGEIIPNASAIGSYQITYTPDEICLADTTLTITVIGVPIVNPISDITLCVGTTVNSIMFSGNASTYDWTNSNPLIGIPNSGTGNISSFIAQSNGSSQLATIEVTPSVGQCIGNPESFVITVNVADSATIAYPIPSSCQLGNDVPVTISGTLGGVFSASPSGLSIEQSTGTISPSGSTNGVYTVTYQTSSTCPGEALTTFEISDGPAIVGIPDIIVCDGDQINFPLITTGNPQDSIYWEILPSDLLGIGNSGNSGVIPSIVAVNSDTTPLTVTISAYAVSSLGCVGPTQVFDVIVNPIPEVSFYGDVLSGCEPHEVLFTASSNTNSATCLWEFGNGSTSDNCGQAIGTYMAGEYDVTLTVTSDVGCVNSMTLFDYIKVYSTPIANFHFYPGQIDIMNTGVQFFNTSVNAASYEWNFGDGSAISTELNPSHNFPNDPNSGYTITLWAYDENNQCSDSVQHSILVEDVLIYYVPNTFTPDDDEFNQSFQPVFTSGFDPYDFHMMIFDRWGELIFESFNANEGWDGTYNGKVVQDGTYTWNIEFKTTKTDERKSLVGHVSLIR